MSGEALEIGIAQQGRGISIFWMPALGPDEEPFNARLFTSEAIRILKMDPDIWRTQYLLEGPGEGDSEFNEADIRAAMFEYADAGHLLIRYKGYDFDEDRLDEQGFAVLAYSATKVRLDYLRYYMHVDPKHRKDSQRKSKNRQKMEAALVIAGIAPDGHAFVPDYWHADADVDALAIAMLRYYCRWAPYRVSYESIGAQVWLKSYIEEKEKSDTRFKRPRARTRWGAEFELPRMSSRMVEAEKQNESKEEAYRSMLGGWFSRKALHLDKKRHDAILHQLTHTADDNVAVDLVDCLAQGPAVWQAPREPGIADHASASRRKFIETFLRQQRSGGAPAHRPPSRYPARRRALRPVG